MTLLELKREINVRCQAYCDIRVGNRVLHDDQNSEMVRDLFKSKDKIILERKQDPEVKQAQFLENG